MILYYADPHFGHTNVIRHDNRPFSNVDDMDKTLIEYYNSRVTDKNDVYIVGDLVYRSNKPAEWYLEQLNGRKHLILGNHDKTWLKDKKLEKYFIEIDKLYCIKDGYNQVVLCHYPMAEWDGFFRGAYHVYAHIHNNTNDAYYFMKNKERALNAGCMINNYMTVTLQELIINNNIFKLKH